MLHKSFELLETKADGNTGEFTALVSTFGNVDKVGDRFRPGAWTKSLERWKASGDPIPIILAHQWDDPMAHIGIARPEDVKQVARGLQVKGKLDVEDNPVARQVFKLMKRRSLKEFSIGYSVPAGGEHRAKDGANEITESELAETGPCLKGIDPKTELQAVKSALAETAEPPPETEGAEKELQEVKARLDTLEKALEDLRSKAEVADKEPEARSVDPLRKQADAVALEVASGGQGLRKPPPKVASKPPELLPLDELKRRMRDEMLGVLSGGITE